MRRSLAVVSLVAFVAASCSSGDKAVERVVDTTGSASSSDSGDVTDITASPDTTVAGSEVVVPDSAAPVTPGGGWTVLVYSIADTDLEPFLMEDVGEMGDVGSGAGVNIVGLVDRSSDYSSDPVLGIDDWAGGKLLHIGQGDAEVLADLGDVNTGDPQLLADFIAAGITAYPPSGTR